MSKTAVFKISVLMADHLTVPVGTKIDFQIDKKNQLYIASSELTEFGLAKTMINGSKEDLQELGSTFSGIVTKVDAIQKQLVVQVRKRLQNENI